MNSKRARQASVWVAAAMTLGLALTACGSDKPEARGSSLSTSELDGDPIRIGEITDASISATQSVVPGAVDAAAKYINEELGGIQGRPVEIVHCDPKATPAGTQTCADQMVKEGVFAVTGASLVLGACCVSTLVNAEIPLFTVPLQTQEYESDWVVGLGGYAATNSFGVGSWVADQGAEKVTLITLDTPASESQTERLTEALGDSVDLTTISIALGTADVTPFINQALGSDPDYMVVFVDTPTEIKLQAAFKSAGFPMDHIVSGGSSVDADSFYGPAGDQAAGVHQTIQFHSFFNTEDPEVATYLEAMDAAGAKAQSLFAQWTFSSMMTIYNAAKDLDELTGSALHEYFVNAESVPTFMGDDLIPLSETVDGFAGIRNPHVQIVQWNGEELVPVARVNGLVKE
jgi:branched-chain amino acid transport system substrate-binding protein